MSTRTITLHAVSPYGRQASSTRVRLADWIDRLGLEARWHEYAGLPDNRPRRLARHPALVLRSELGLHTTRLEGATVVLSREAGPFTRGGVEERILRSARHGVFDFDDALFHDAGRVRRVLGQARKCERAVAAADVVIAGNDYLADWATGFSSDVRVIPSCIDPDSYSPKGGWEVGATPRLVWLGSPATEPYVAQIAPALLEVHARTGARLTVISGRDAGALSTLAPMLDRVPWRLDTVAQALSSADVAIAPLDDSPYSRGKCAYKLLQYAATEVPMVGSPVGANETALQRFSGLAASGHGDWVDALIALLAEPSSQRRLRAQTGAAAVREHYSFAAWEATWRSAVLT